MEDEHKRSGMMTRDEWLAWLRESWDEAQKIAASYGEELHPVNHTLEPVAYVTGFYNGHCVIQPTDPALVLPVGMALYRAPDVFKLIEDNGLTLHGDIEHFAELIRQEEREACAKILEADANARAVEAKEWVGLTDDEVSEIIDREIGFNSCFGPEESFARAIEAKLKEKNT